MQSRWYHRPIFHNPLNSHEKKPSWLELFYDLIFVAAFIQLGHALSHDISITGFFRFSAIFTILWTIWTGFTNYINRFQIDDFAHRILVFCQVMSVGGIAIYAPKAFGIYYFPFSVSIGFSLAIIGILYARSIYDLDQRVKSFSKHWSGIFLTSSFIWFVSPFLPSTFTYTLWLVGTLIIFTVPLTKQSRELSEYYPRDREHLSERYGIFTIIVLGESFVEVISVLDGSDTGAVFLQLCFAVLMTIAIWWVYFDGIAGAPIKKQRLNSIIWMYTHLPFQLGVTAYGVAAKTVVHIPLSTSINPAYAWLISGVLALSLFSVSGLDSITKRDDAQVNDQLRVNTRIITAFMLLLLPFVSTTMSAGLFLSIIVILTISLIVFDMMMAPLKAVDAHMNVVSGQSLVEQSRNTDQKPQGDIQVIRKGSPNAFKKDAYYFLIEGSWTRLFTAISISYIFINIVFAVLYTVSPTTSTIVENDTFIDAFFFSVRTFSKIGYGAMSDPGLLNHILVTIEALIGLLFVALSTGLIFAKVSRPHATVMFSKQILIHKRNNKRILMFRVANARGSDILDAYKC